MKKIILIPPCFTYGDCLSVIGLVYYLSNHYDNVFFYLGESNPKVFEYYTYYFKNDPSFNNRIFLTDNAKQLINEGSYGEYHICNIHTGDWSKANTMFYDLPNIDKEYYFNDLNPIYNKLDVSDIDKCFPNKHLPSTSVQTNHTFYYELIGLSNSVRMNSFNYVRNKDAEIEFKKAILESFGLTSDQKYNIINDPKNQSMLLEKYITNGLPTINIDFLAPCPSMLLTLLEDAESIHFIEGCNVNFFYHCQYKDIFKYDKKIFFHIWARNREWNDPNMNLDFAWKMMDIPRLENWMFLFNENEAEKLILKTIKIISHRGNINGPVDHKENRPSYIDAALQLGLDVEVDIRYVDGKFMLGHDIGDYEVSDVWIMKRKSFLWFHCKDLNSVYALHKIDPNILKFCHSSDPYVLVSNGMTWVHNLKLNLDINCIIPLLSIKDINEYNGGEVYGICTDFPIKLTK